MERKKENNKFIIKIKILKISNTSIKVYNNESNL